MSPASEQAHQRNLLFPVTFEQYHCPAEACDAAIPQQFVFNTFTEGRDGPGRIVRVFCPHCERIHERAFVLRGGQWQPDGDVKLVTRPATVRGIRRQVDQINGVHLAQSA
jgi:hypothetical protein